MATELERRFLLDRLPSVEPISTTMVRQAYWRLGNGWCLRLRRVGPDRGARDSIAVKGPRVGHSRPEFEMYVIRPGMSRAEVARALDDVVALYLVGSEHQVVKLRRSYFLDGLTWDVDEFLWKNDGLIIAEIEMGSENELLDVETPAWALREITDDERYNNENLAFAPYKTWK